MLHRIGFDRIPKLELKLRHADFFRNTFFDPMSASQTIVLLGSNIAHSWSPRLHNYLFARFDLPYRYDLMPVEAGEVPAALERLKSGGYRGANITSPHKEILFDLLDEHSATAKRIGAVNTIVIDNGRAVGHNTDTVGFRRSLHDEMLTAEPFTAGVIGTGGAARAAVDVLLGFEALQEIVLYSRSQSKASDVRARWNDERLRSATLDSFAPVDLLVHATPVGLPGREGRVLEPEKLRGVELLYEMIYHPAITPLMVAATEAGARTIGGRRMFIEQGLESFRLWTGIAADANELPADLL